MNRLKSFIPAFCLGIAFFLAIFFVKPIGVSTAFSVAAGSIQQKVQGDYVYKDASHKSGYGSKSAYLDASDGKLAEEVANPWNYGNIFVLSIMGGAFIAHLLDPRARRARQAQKRIADQMSRNPVIQDNLRENWSGYFKAFMAGFILLYGARMAGGCTSGHMMSGMMQSSVSGYFFAMSVFAVAIPLAIYLHNRKGA